MPRATLLADESGVMLAFSPAPTDGTTPSFGPLIAGQGVDVEGGSMAAAAAFTIIANGQTGLAPALVLMAVDAGVVFAVSPVPPEGVTEEPADAEEGAPPEPLTPPVVDGVAVIGPLNPGDAVTLPEGAYGDPNAYTVQVLTTAQAQSLGLIS